METIKKDLKIDSRTTFKFVIELLDSDDNPIDLTDHLVKAEIRESSTSVDILAAFLININALEGTIELSLDPMESAKLQLVKNTIKPEYDVLMRYPDMSVKKLVKGKISITKTVTIL